MTTTNIPTTELDITPSQEKSLEYALVWMGLNNFYSSNYRFRSIDFENCADHLRVMIVIDNSLPGTVGYVIPDFFIFYIGRRGGIWSYEDTECSPKGFVTRRGEHALIHSRK